MIYIIIDEYGLFLSSISGMDSPIYDYCCWNTKREKAIEFKSSTDAACHARHLQREYGSDVTILHTNPCEDK